MRNRILWAAALLMLVVINIAIAHKERLIAQGSTVLLALAPRDPRSLMQGDYMTLSYVLADEIRAQVSIISVDGQALIALDERGVARFVRLHVPGAALAAHEQILRFRKRGSTVRLATDAFFFQEGQASHYSNAKYGELRVDAAGEAVLIGLRDEHLRPLGKL